MIIVTPGHYASAVGASGPNNFTEYPETRLWAKELKYYLGQEGLFVGARGLTAKVRAINRLCSRYDVKLVLEVHFNSAKNSAGKHVGRGSETLYYPGSKTGRYIAQKVQRVLASHFDPDRGVKEGYYRRRKTSGALYLLEKTRCPAIIIEPEFVQYSKKIKSRRSSCCSDLADVLRQL